MKKKRRGISRYTVMFIPDTSDNAKTYELTFDTLARWIVGVLAFFAIVVCLFISVILRNNQAMYGENGYVEQIKALKEENRELMKKAEDMEGVGKDSARADTEGKDKDPETLEDVPGIFPVRGTATMIKDPTSLAESFPNRLVLIALSGSEIVAAADGVVEEVLEYEKKEGEFSVAVMLDHRNGYETVYLLSGEPYILVQKGSKLWKGDVIAKLSDEETVVGYDIMYGGESLDPSELIDETE